MIQRLLFGADEIPVYDGQRGDSSTFRVGMLTLAREAKGYTQKDLAGKIGCNQSRLSRIEAGELAPPEDDIQNFVKFLEQDRDFFFQPGEATPTSVSFYRKTQTLQLKTFKQCNAQMNIRRLEIEKKVGSAKLGSRELPYFSPTQNGGARAVALLVRQAWGIQKGSVQHLTQMMEDAGCVVVNHSFPSAKLDGLCIRALGKPPIIFLNKDLPKSRRRLSLAHELGHLVMHTEPHEEVETEAWDFAAEFLMPASEIGGQLGSLNLERLSQLKKEWAVSMQAILYRARKLDRITENQSRFLWMQIGKYGYRVNEPFEDAIPDELPTEIEQRMKGFT